MPRTLISHGIRDFASAVTVRMSQLALTNMARTRRRKSASFEFLMGSGLTLLTHRTIGAVTGWRLIPLHASFILVHRAKRARMGSLRMILSQTVSFGIALILNNSLNYPTMLMKMSFIAYVTGATLY